MHKENCHTAQSTGALQLVLRRISLWGPSPGEMVAKGRTAWGDPAEVVDGEEFGGPGDPFAAGLCDDQRVHRTGDPVGLERAAPPGLHHPAQIAVRGAVGGDALRGDDGGHPGGGVEGQGEQGHDEGECEAGPAAGAWPAFLFCSIDRAVKAPPFGAAAHGSDGEHSGVITT